MGCAHLFAEKLSFSVPAQHFLRLCRRPLAENGGIAAEIIGRLPEKQSFSANRAAKPPLVNSLNLSTGIRELNVKD